MAEQQQTDEQQAERTFTQEEVNDAVPFGGCFQNCNTPAELKALEEAVTD